MLGILFLMPGIIFSSNSRKDTLLVNKVFGYKDFIGRNWANKAHGNLYLKYKIHTRKRNPTMMLVPRMYEMSYGRRDYIGEMYGTITYIKDNSYVIYPQVYSNTFRHYFRLNTNIQEMLTPSIYEPSIFNNRLLSPFNKSNHIYYKYQIDYIDSATACIKFKPRTSNTQLVKGLAFVERNCGRITSTTFSGEYDMTKFDINVIMGDSLHSKMLPVKCTMNVRFSFLGNNIDVTQEATYDKDFPTLPDSVYNKKDLNWMKKLRVRPLTEKEQSIYDASSSNGVSDSLKKNKISKFFISLGDELFNSHRAKFGQGNMDFSPIFNPLSFSYSRHKGFSYQFNFNLGYDFNESHNLRLPIKFGYNFKLKQFFYDIPLTFNYNHFRNAYIRVDFGNGNRIVNSSILNQLMSKTDTIDYRSLHLDYFDDRHLEVINSVDIFKWWTIQVGFMYHHRRAVMNEIYEALGKRTLYESFEPKITMKFCPWIDAGPVLIADFEGGLRNNKLKYSQYDKWEFDATYKVALQRLQTLSLRAGCGYYTHKASDSFLDYDNFHDYNLPEKWNDDWTGQFQLLSNYWYNSSDYYIRGNMTYESPIFLLTWIPYFGRAIELERIYCNTLMVDRLHPYTEIGYGFTNRYISVAGFMGFNKHHFSGVGCKFTFEIFNHW
jgi:hypothetical protein